MLILAEWGSIFIWISWR